jgi:hypothetical protein
MNDTETELEIDRSARSPSPTNRTQFFDAFENSEDLNEYMDSQRESEPNDDVH